jgi:hypothetical protein
MSYQRAVFRLSRNRGSWVAAYKSDFVYRCSGMTNCCSQFRSFPIDAWLSGHVF